MRFRFHLRDIFWLIVVVAMAAGWWHNSRQLTDAITRLQRVRPKVSLSDPAVERAMQMDTLR